MPEISIIIPVYKVESYLEKCINSVIAQTFTDIEIILVDDGSPDRCPEICDKYAVVDKRIVVIHKENGGLSSARNAGLEVAQGRYIGFVDSDDFIHPKMYEVLLELLLCTNSDFVQCGTYKFCEEDNISAVVEGEYRLLDRAEFLDNFSPNNKYIITGSVWNKLFKKEIFENIRFPVGQLFEDSHIKVHVLELSQKVCIYSGELYFYRQNPYSIMNSRYTQKWFEGNSSNCENDCLFFKEKNMIEQFYYSLDDYVRFYIKDRLAVFLFYPNLKRSFKSVTTCFNSFLWDVMNSSITCRMKKITLLLSFIHPRTAYKLCRKYFPECLYDFMR